MAEVFKGRISKNYSVHCGVCCQSEVLFALTAHSAAREARDYGWSEKKTSGWTCRKCQEEGCEGYDTRPFPCYGERKANAAEG